MIRYDEIQSLEGDQAVRVHALIDRSSEIWDMPNDLSQVEAWERQALRCEAEGLPHYVASARFGQYLVYSQGGMPRAALDAYARLMQVVAQFGEYIAPENIARFLGSVSSLVSDLIDDPTIPRAQIEHVIGLVEEQIRARGLDMSNVYLARAELASECGDEAAMTEWRHRWQAEGSEEWPENSTDTVLREVAMIANHNPAEAISVLEQRFMAMGVAPGLLDTEHPDLDQHAMMRALLGWLYARVGRRDVAAIIGDELMTQFSAEWLSRNVVLDEALIVLEHRPQDAEVVADYALSQAAFEATDGKLIGAVARNRILADPQAEEGRLLQHLAFQRAQQHDERGGTDLHTRELQEFWFAGLPEGPRPALVDDEAWNDVEERAERILLSGWLPRRKKGLTSEKAPIALKNRYVALTLRSHDVYGAESAAEAAALVASIEVDSQKYRLPTAAFAANIMQSGRAAENGDCKAFLASYETVQQLALEHYDVIDPSIRDASSHIFAIAAQLAVAEPEVPLERIRELIAREAQLRQQLGLPLTPLLQAEAELAAHFGDGQSLQRLAGEIANLSEAEADALSRPNVCLELVRLVWPFAPDYAESMARWALEASQEEDERRAATTWLGWFAQRRGGDSRVDEVIGMLEDLYREMDEFGPVPASILLDIAIERPDELPWIIESVVNDMTPGLGMDLDSLASVSKLLLERFPEDERGPQMRDEALRIVKALNTRNGNTFQSDAVRRRWGHALSAPLSE